MQVCWSLTGYKACFSIATVKLARKKKKGSEGKVETETHKKEYSFVEIRVCSMNSGTNETKPCFSTDLYCFLCSFITITPFIMSPCHHNAL